jgi:uncharacterized protein YceK
MILAICLLLSGCSSQASSAASSVSTSQQAEGAVASDSAQETENATASSAEQGSEEAAAPDTTDADASDTEQATSENTQNPSNEYEVPASAADGAEIDYFTAYQSVFEDYEEIFTGSWSMDDYIANDFPQQLIYCMGDAPYDNIGYLLLDLDGDGIQELLIGEASSDPFYDCLLLQMYTLEDGNVVKVLTSQNSAWYQLCVDQTLVCTTDDGTATHYTYSNAALTETTSDSSAQKLGFTAFSLYEQLIKS